MPITPDGGFALAVARFCAVSTMLSAFGSLLFRAVVLPKVLARQPDAAPSAHAISLLARWSLAACLAALLAWAVLQTADFAHSGHDLKLLATAWPVVLLHTVYGHLLLGQFAAVLAAGLLVPKSPRVALALAAVAVLLQAGHSHAESMYDGPSLLLGSDMLHLLASGAWLGGLVPLLLVVRNSSPRAGAAAARWFSPLGKWCVAVLVASAGFQFWVLIGGLPGLIGTQYGWVALAKLLLLVLLLGFAVLNRYRFAPALMRADPEPARRTLVRSVALQTGVGVAVLLAASLLCSLPPALHEQPLWPFAWRPSLEVMAEPELAAEVWQGALLAACAAGVLATLLWRRMRRGALLAAVALASATLAWFAWPHLSLLLVEANPTSYYASPTNFAAASIMQGVSLYPTHCAACHGRSGRGDGPQAAGLPVPPADLTAGHLWAHSDGELFWWLSHGIEGPDGALAMPGFATVLTVAQRWALIDAIRARNAGTAFRDTGAWSTPVQLPAFDLACPSGDTTTDALRGRAIYLVSATDGAAPPVAPDPNTVSVLLTARTIPSWPGCTANPGGAVAILLGQTPAAPIRLLVDPNGWLRAAKIAGNAAQWDDKAVLSAAIGSILAAPLAAGSAHHHHGN